MFIEKKSQVASKKTRATLPVAIYLRFSSANVKQDLKNFKLIIYMENSVQFNCQKKVLHFSLFF